MRLPGRVFARLLQPDVPPALRLLRRRLQRPRRGASRLVQRRVIGVGVQSRPVDSVF